MLAEIEKRVKADSLEELQKLEVYEIVETMKKIEQIARHRAYITSNLGAVKAEYEELKKKRIRLKYVSREYATVKHFEELRHDEIKQLEETIERSLEAEAELSAKVQNYEDRMASIGLDPFEIYRAFFEMESKLAKKEKEELEEKFAKIHCPGGPQ